MTFIGIDNGVSGAVAAITDHSVEVEPVRIYLDGKDKCIDEAWLHELIGCYPGAVVAVEKAQKFSAGKLALCSTWNSWATIRTVLRLSKCSFRSITPQQWMRHYNIAGKPEDTGVLSVRKAKELFPKVSLRRSARCTTDDDGMSDALLIANWLKHATLNA